MRRIGNSSGGNNGEPRSNGSNLRRSRAGMIGYHDDSHQVVDRYRVENASTKSATTNTTNGNNFNPIDKYQPHQQQSFDSDLMPFGGPNLITPDNKRSLSHPFFDNSSNTNNTDIRVEDDRYHPSTVERNCDTQDRVDSSDSSSSTSTRTTSQSDDLSSPAASSISSFSSPTTESITESDAFAEDILSPLPSPEASSINTPSPPAIESETFPSRIDEEQDGTPWNTHGAFDNTDSIGPVWYDPFARHGRKFIPKQRVKFQANVVTNIRPVPRVDRSKKSELFYTPEDFMQFREEVIYRQEATWENLVVDFCEEKWEKIQVFCGCKEAVKKAESTETDEITEEHDADDMDIDELLHDENKGIDKTPIL